MNPDIFEVVMLICFGTAWPFSIYKMFKTKKSNGKSVYFLTIVLIGYMSGILFEYFDSKSLVICLYLLNTAMVIVDFVLTIKYSRKNIKADF